MDTQLYIEAIRQLEKRCKMIIEDLKKINRLEVEKVTLSDLFLEADQSLQDNHKRALSRNLDRRDKIIDLIFELEGNRNDNL